MLKLFFGMILLIGFISCQRNQSSNNGRSDKDSLEFAVTDSVGQEHDTTTVQNSFVDPEILPKLKWGMKVPEIKSLDQEYTNGRYEEYLEGSGLWQYKFDRHIEQLGTYGSFTFQFPNQYERKGWISVKFIECESPVMRNNEISKSLDCIDIQQRVIKYMDGRFGNPSVMKKTDNDGSSTSYIWYSQSSKIELLDFGPSMVVIWSPK